MSNGRQTDFSLPKLDEFFSSQGERDNGKMPVIKDIPLSLLNDFPNHPFSVRFDDDMLQLIESVSERGVLTPAIVRKKSNDNYELISGHRRKKASELCKISTLRCVVLDLSDEDATILMVDSNIQRTNVPPSEKAKAYQMRYEAVKKQGFRTDLTSSQVETKFRSDKKLADDMGVSRAQIQRYMRLNYLVPELLEMVDEGKIKMSPAVEISYLNEDCQRDLVDAIDDECCTPSHAQAIRLHNMFKENTLTREIIFSVMKEEKANQIPKITIRQERVKKFLPQNLKKEQTEEYICKALEHYGKYLQRVRERNNR